MLKFAYRAPTPSSSSAAPGAPAVSGSRRPRDEKRTAVRPTSTSGHSPRRRDDESSTKMKVMWRTRCVRNVNGRRRCRLNGVSNLVHEASQTADDVGESG